MDELLQQLGRELANVWRFRWLAVAVAWLCAIAGWTVVLALPDEYEANGKVFVDTESAARRLLKGVLPDTDIQSRVDLVRQVMLSRPHLEEVARKTDLDLRVDTPRQFEELVETLRRDILVTSEADKRRTKGSQFERNLYTISYRDVDRSTAEAVVQALLNTFVEQSLVDDRDEAGRAVRFLEEQVLLYAERLNESERRLADFKRENMGLLPGEGGDYFARLQSEIDQREGVRQELNIAEERRRAISAQIGGDGSSAPGDEALASTCSDLDRQISDQETRLDELLLLYTEKFPDVIRARETLASLRERYEDKDCASATVAGSSSIYESARIALNQMEVEIAALRGRLMQHDAKIRELRELVDTIPQVEAQYAQLVRDYGVTKSQYEDLLERQEQARISGDVDRKGNDVEFDVIDPPKAAMEPAAPDRPLLLTGVLLAAIGIGCGAAWFLSQLRPIFSSRRSLHDETGFPVLGAVSMAWSPRQIGIRRLERLALVAAFSLLLFLFGIVFLVQDPATRILQRLVS